MADNYYRVMTGDPKHPVLIFKEFEYGDWCCYYEHEYKNIATYNPLAKTPEQAFTLFVRYRINGCKANPISYRGLDTPRRM